MNEQITGDEIAFERAGLLDDWRKAKRKITFLKHTMQGLLHFANVFIEEHVEVSHKEQMRTELARLRAIVEGEDDEL